MTGLNLSHHLSPSSLLQLKGRLITSAVSLTGNIHRSLAVTGTSVKPWLFALEPHIRFGMLSSLSQLFKPTFAKSVLFLITLRLQGSPCKGGSKAIESWDRAVQTVESDWGHILVITARRYLFVPIVIWMEPVTKYSLLSDCKHSGASTKQCNDVWYCGCTRLTEPASS